MSANDAVTINGETWRVDEEIPLFTKDSEGNKKALYALRRLSNARDDGVWLMRVPGRAEKPGALYAPLPGWAAEGVAMFDVERAVTREGVGVTLGQGTVRDEGLSSQAPAPMRGAQRVFAFNETLYLSRGLLQDGDGYVTDNQPASRMVAQRLPVVFTGFSRRLLNWAVIGLLVLLMVLDLREGNGAAGLDAIVVFWVMGMAGALALALGRGFVLHTASAVVASGLGLAVVTSVVSHQARATQGEVGAHGAVLGHLLLCVLIMAVLRAGAPKVAGIVGRGALLGGLGSLGVYAAGLLLWSAIDEHWWFDYAAWYLGSVPMGYVWPLAFVGLTYQAWRDYRDAPLSAWAFSAQLEAIAHHLERGAEHVWEHAEALALASDDLVDAIDLSTSDAVTMLANHKSRFVWMKLGFKQLSELSLEVFEDRACFVEDMETLAGDLRRLARVVDEPPISHRARVPSLRVSPCLRGLIPS